MLLVRPQKRQKKKTKKKRPGSPERLGERVELLPGGVPGLGAGAWGSISRQDAPWGPW